MTCQDGTVHLCMDSMPTVLQLHLQDDIHKDTRKIVDVTALTDPDRVAPSCWGGAVSPLIVTYKVLSPPRPSLCHGMPSCVNPIPPVIGLCVICTRNATTFALIMLYIAVINIAVIIRTL